MSRRSSPLVLVTAEAVEVLPKDPGHKLHALTHQLQEPFDHQCSFHAHKWTAAPAHASFMPLLN